MALFHLSVTQTKRSAGQSANVLGLVDIFVDRGPFQLPLLCRALCRQAQAESKCV